MFQQRKFSYPPVLSLCYLFIWALGSENGTVHTLNKANAEGMLHVPYIVNVGTGSELSSSGITKGKAAKENKAPQVL